MLFQGRRGSDRTPASVSLPFLGAEQRNTRPTPARRTTSDQLREKQITLKTEKVASDISSDRTYHMVIDIGGLPRRSFLATDPPFRRNRPVVQ
jgi:hypothetical protein